MLRFLAFLAPTFLLSCAQIPDATTRYYLTKSSLRIEVTRTLSCNEKDELFVGHFVLPVIVNSADLDSSQEFDLGRLRGAFVDPDLKIEFTPDGRISSINSTQTGTAKQIVESSLSVASNLLTLRSNRSDNSRSNTEKGRICGLVERFGNKSKVLTLNYSGPVDTTVRVDQRITPTGSSEAIHNLIFGQSRTIHTRVTDEDFTKLSPPIKEDSTNQNYGLVARQLTRLELNVHASGGTEIWRGAVLLALKGNEYEIPLPRKPAFGKAEFSATFNDAGGLTNLNYKSSSGAADAISVIDSGIATVQGTSTKEQVDEVRAQADLIKQRERLAACQANPSECE